MKYSRRQFIETAAAGMGAMLLHTRYTDAAPVAAGNFDPYDMVELGNTGVKTTRLCMGTGISSGGRQSNLTRMGYEQGVQFVRELYSRGVRMFDMADVYGTHAIVSDALKIYPRNDFVLFTKLWFLPGALPEAERPDAKTVVERFLKELQTDYIDGVQLHCVTSANWNTELSDYMTLLDKLKQNGMIRTHGINCHSLAALKTSVQEPWVDTVHVRINAHEAKMDDTVENVEPIVKQLHRNGKGIIAMKILGESAFSNSDEQRDASFRHILRLGAVDAIVVEMDKTDDIVDTENRIRKNS